MVMKLDRIVPLGRSLDEYSKMFALSSVDLQQRILGVGDGPASFNAEGTKVGLNIISIDPIYQFSGAEIKLRFEAIIDNIIDQVIATPNNWVWKYYRNPQDLKANRIRIFQTFLQDYELGKQEARYQSQELPQLDFTTGSFDLTLCSHLLFLYSQQFSLDFHVASIQEILRVSREVRIFPLLTLMQQTYPYLDVIMQKFNDLGYTVMIKPVPYEFQPGGNKMLIIKHEDKMYSRFN